MIWLHAMSSYSEIKKEQVNWAVSQGLTPDKCSYLSCVGDNLLQPLSTFAKAAFDKGKGSELVDTQQGLAKMKALHSSSALAVNVCDYWTCRDATVLGSALGLDSEITKIAFEAQYPTGLRGTPPHLDVVLETASNYQFAIESKFTEWMKPKSTKKKPFGESYFKSSTGLWRQQGLSGCQKLAERIQAEKLFCYLNAAQLLKHALGLSKNLGSAFSLHYIYYDWPGEAANLHKQEIKEFSACVCGTMNFSAISYQELYPRLQQAAGDQHAEYLAYLGGRYFHNN